jgi:hypothetical protein
MGRYDIALGKGPQIEPAPEPKIEPSPDRSGMAAATGFVGVQGGSEPVLTRSERETIIAQCLRTAAGRGRLSASMIEPARRRLAYQSFARRIFTMKQIPDGTLPTYQHTGTMYSIDGTGLIALELPGQPSELPPNCFGHQQVIVPLFEIAANPTVSLTRIRERRYDLIERAQEEAIQSIASTEEGLAVILLDGLTDAYDRKVVTKEATLSRDAFTEAFSMIERSELRVSNILINALDYVDMRKWGKEFIDAFQIWEAHIIVSPSVPEGNIFLLAGPAFVGHMPIRTNLAVLPADDPERRLMGWSFFENLGMCCINPLATVKISLAGKLPVVTDHVSSWIVGEEDGTPYQLSVDEDEDHDGNLITMNEEE